MSDTIPTATGVMDGPSAQKILTASPTLGYIAGTSYSGSTLLSFLLNAQPDVVSVGEVVWAIPSANPGRYRCSCGATLDQCEFWREVAREMKLRGHEFGPTKWQTSFYFTPNRFLRRVACQTLGSNLLDDIRDRVVSNVPNWKQRLSEIGARNKALFESIAAIKGASVFVDGSKDHDRVKALRRYSGIQPYVIHLVRDSPAFVSSYMKVGSPDAFREGIAWWKRAAWHMERLRSTTPEGLWLRVRYEDLCSDPRSEIKRILRFLKVASDSPVLDFRSASHHIIGNRWRLGNADEIKLDASWREKFSSSQIETILSSTAKYRARFGYLERSEASNGKGR